MSLLRTIVSLCCGFKAYRQIRDLALTSSMKYLLKLMAVLAVILVASFVPWALQTTREFARWVDEHFPRFSIQEGKVLTDVEQPHYAGDTDFLVILDTTGQVTGPDPEALQGVLFMADSFLVWIRITNAPQPSLQSQRHSLRGLPDGTVNGDYFRRLIRTSLWVGLPLSLLVLILLGSLTSLLQAYLFSLIASLMERTMPSPLDFKQLLNIAIHAVTPAAIVVTAYMAMRLRGLDLWLIYLIAYGIFLVGATHACRNRTETP